MFANIKYGSGESFLLNINCGTQTLLDYIKEKCVLTKDVTVDLCDVNGCARLLFTQGKTTNASNYLQGRETYIPIEVHRDEANVVTGFTPILEECSEILEYISDKLELQAESLQQAAKLLVSIPTAEVPPEKSGHKLSTGRKSTINPKPSKNVLKPKLGSSPRKK
ncbi:uncharacterized protein CXorf65 [Lingula anatina]|uniref:Uncharacterized protein CXorf65 n=1 Tax=Lingula anatina TaxID=7574 RepID=A0A1S3IL93_LINAN|nr:uncharacterized protein CXorf65 [Lingula anatina]|eukprot:XP_013398656.1 uncharacterized protein CXorf65 [Lingula anatina]